MNINSQYKDYPLVSIVVPAYNHESYIANCIHSILEQDYPDMDLIVINDGSTDGTDQRIKEIHAKKPLRFRYISKQNEGLIKTLNLGLKLAQGKYFCELASDDMLLPEDDLGVSPYILFTGYRKDVLELLRGLDAFVFSSLAEGLPIALLEAMASRLPVIASNVGGIPEVFGSTNCGLFVPPKDSHAIAEAMIKIGLLDNEKRKVMGEVARERVEEAFTTEIMCKRLIEAYKSLVLQNTM